MSANAAVEELAFGDPHMRFADFASFLTCHRVQETWSRVTTELCYFFRLCIPRSGGCSASSSSSSDDEQACLLFGKRQHKL
jgi:hypothetical protein